MQISKEKFTDCIERLREYYGWLGEFSDMLGMGELVPALDELGVLLTEVILGDAPDEVYDDFWNILIFSDVEDTEIEDFYERIID